MKRFLYFLLHLIFGCREDDIDWHVRCSVGKCRKCGRVYFNWD